MSVESQINELVSAFVADLEQLVRETALEHVRQLLGAPGSAGTTSKRAAPVARRAKRTAAAEAAPAQQAAAKPEAADEAPAVDPWMRPLRPGVLETLDVRRRRRRGPKRRTEPTRAPIPREPPVRALRVDGVTIIPSDDTDEAPRPAPAPVEPAAAEAAPAAVGEPVARKWVVVRRPARDKQDASLLDELGEPPIS
jgi:hypothetical protein